MPVPKKNGAMGWLRRYLAMLTQAGAGAIRHPWSSLGVSILAATLMIWIACIEILLERLKTLQQDRLDGSVLTIFFDTTMAFSEARARALGWEDWQEIERVRLISPEEALAEMVGDTDALHELRGEYFNPLPTTALVSLDDSLSAAEIHQVSQRLGGEPGVDSIRMDRDWMQKMQALLAVLQRIRDLFLGLMTLGLLLLFYYFLRFRASDPLGSPPEYARREGYSFLFAGLLYGLSSSILALVALTSILLMLTGPFEALTKAYGLPSISIWIPRNIMFALLLAGPSLGLLGALLGLVTSALADRRKG